MGWSQAQVFGIRSHTTGAWRPHFGHRSLTSILMYEVTGSCVSSHTVRHPSTMKGLSGSGFSGLHAAGCHGIIGPIPGPGPPFILPPFLPQKVACFCVKKCAFLCRFLHSPLSTLWRQSGVSGFVPHPEASLGSPDWLLHPVVTARLGYLTTRTYSASQPEFPPAIHEVPILVAATIAVYFRWFHHSPRDTLSASTWAEIAFGNHRHLYQARARGHTRLAGAYTLRSRNTSPTSRSSHSYGSLSSRRAPCAWLFHFFGHCEFTLHHPHRNQHLA